MIFFDCDGGEHRLAKMGLTHITPDPWLTRTCSATLPPPLYFSQPPAKTMLFLEALYPILATHEKRPCPKVWRKESFSRPWIEAWGSEIGGGARKSHQDCVGYKKKSSKLHRICDKVFKIVSDMPKSQQNTIGYTKESAELHRIQEKGIQIASDM